MSRRPQCSPAKLWLHAPIFLVLLLPSTLKAQLKIATQAATCGRMNGNATITIDQTIAGPPPYSIALGANLFTSPTNVYTFNGLGPGLYSIIVRDAGGNLVAPPDVLPIGDLVSPQIIVTPRSASCLNNDGGVTISQISMNGPFSYSINGVDFLPTPTFTGLASGNNLIATVKDVNGCTTSSPPVTIPLLNDLVVATRAVAPICEGTAVTLEAGGNGLHYSWTPTTGLSDATALNPSASPHTTTTYTLTATRGTCTKTAQPTVTVTVNPAPIADAGPGQETCYGRSVNLQGSGGATSLWPPATYLTNPQVPFPKVGKPTQTITYNLQVTDAKGCVSLSSDMVTVTVTPPLKVIASPDTIVYAGQPAPLFAVAPAGTGQLAYAWSPAEGLDNPFVSNPTAVLHQPQEVTYVAQVTTNLGCVGTDTVVVKAFAVTDILVPNAFSPNNDGRNDVLRPKMPGIKTLHFFSVFNRFGQQVFTTNAFGMVWDGAMNGRVLPTGTYVWVVEGVDISGKTVQRKGTVVLVR
jgi:gliding motility-associated-like protein